MRAGGNYLQAEEVGGRMTYGLVGPTTHKRDCPKDLRAPNLTRRQALRLGTTPMGLTEAGAWVWLARLTVLWIGS